MAAASVPETDRQKQREAFRKTRENHVSLQGAILLRYTKDKKLIVSVSPHLEIEWKFFPGAVYGTYFFPGNKMMCEFLDKKLYTAEFLGQFPSREMAEQRMAQLEAEEKRFAKPKLQEAAARPRKGSNDKLAKRANLTRSSRETGSRIIYCHFMNDCGFDCHLYTKDYFPEKLLSLRNLEKTEFQSLTCFVFHWPGVASRPLFRWICFTPGGSAGSELLVTEVKLAPPCEPAAVIPVVNDPVASTSRLLESECLKPLIPFASQELPDDIFGDQTYTEMKAPYCRDTAQHKFVPGQASYFFNTLTGFETAGCWMSQKALVNELGVQIWVDESSQKPSELDELRQLATDDYGFIPKENLVLSDARRFSKEALTTAPIILDNSPKKNQTTVLFPTEIFGKPGAPGIQNNIYGLEKGSSGTYDQLTTVPDIPYRFPGAVLDTKGPFPYVTKLLLPDKVTNELHLAPEKLPRFKDHVEWHTTDMAAESDYYIPTRRTEEKDFTLKNPPRVDRAAITLRDSISKWYFQIPGSDKVVLEKTYPAVFVDNEMLELNRKLMNREITLDKYVWYLMSRMLGGSAGLLRLATLREIAKQKDPKKRLNSFYEEVVGKDFFCAIERAVRGKLSEMLAASGAPLNETSVRWLPKVHRNFPGYFTHKMDNLMRGFKARNEKTTGQALDNSESCNNMESEGEDEVK